MAYIPGQICTMEVIKTFGEQEDFFRLSTQNGEARLKKLKFQMHEPLPDKMRVKIKFINENRAPVVSHIMADYIGRFYDKGLVSDRDYEFTVLSRPERAGEPYILEDEHGLRFNLASDTASLTEGERVNCRVVRHKNGFYNIEIVRADTRLPIIRPEELLEKVGVGGMKAHCMLVALRSMTELADAVEELDHGNPLWVLRALQTCTGSLASWMAQADVVRHHRFFKAAVDVLRRVALYLIEGSRFLRNQNKSRRRSLQKQLTDIIEQLGAFDATLKIFGSGNHIDFVEDIMMKLRESGYLYHPAEQFSSLMIILHSDPTLVRRYLGRIFDTIMEWELDTWTNEPFKSAFVGQFEIYIRHASQQLAALPQAETAENKDLIEKIVTAVALQILIAGDDADRFVSPRNRSLLYRCIALLRPAAADTLLDKAFMTMCGVKLPAEFKYDHVKQPLMLMTRAMVAPPADAAAQILPAAYYNGDLAVNVGAGGISLRRSDEYTDTPVLPSGLMDWELASPQIYLDGIQGLAGSKLGSLDAHRKMLAEVEHTLLERRTPVIKETAERRRADIDDDVRIVIDYEKMTPGTDLNPEWEARIDDPEFEEATGTIRRSEIVDYALRQGDLDFNNRDIARDTFRQKNGRPRHFYAHVIGFDDDGAPRFSMVEEVDEARHDLIDFNSSYHAVITQVLDYEYRAITDSGYGAYLKREPGEQYRPGAMVEFRFHSLSDPEHLAGSIVGYSDGVNVERMTAFHTLMTLLSPDEEDEGAEEPQAKAVEMPDMNDQTLSREDLMEIIEIIRFKALSSKSILTAYDYLCFGRLLALAAGAEETAEQLRLHASMLRMHQFYATNSRIDADELETFRDKVAGHPWLEIMFHRLEIVSWLGRTEADQQLWQVVNNPRNILETTLARLVLSYNMVAESDDADTDGDGPALHNIKGKIASLLGVNFERPNLKSYGTENQFVEFKSSIVYPARKNKNDKVEADPERQQGVILKIIAGFLNASGGTLYIGVNDASRCAAGLFEDLEYYRHRRAKIGTHTFDMKTADNFCVFLENLVRNTWGALVAGSIRIGMDEEAERDVIVVEVQPRTSPVLLDDKIFVRRSSSTVALNDEERTEFLAERRSMEVRQRSEARNTVQDETGKTGENAQSPADASSRLLFSEPETKADLLPTSRWRHNVLHEYEDNYVEPAGYLFIKSDGTLAYSASDIYADNEPDTLLTLAIAPDELHGGALVALFDGQTALRVPLEEIVEKGENRPLQLFHDGGEPLFVTIMMPDQAILSVLSDSRGNLYRRAIRPADIPAGHPGSAPERIDGVPATARTLAAELIPANAVESYSNSLCTALTARQIGYKLKLTSRDHDEAVAKEINDCLAKI